METREVLINDIKNFVKEAIELNNQYKQVERTKYFGLQERILFLNQNDFESAEKYNYFLSFLNQMQRTANRDIVKHLLRNEEQLEVSPFLFMCNDLDGIANWIN